MNTTSPQVLVLRIPADDGNFMYRMAELPVGQLDALERRVREAGSHAIEDPMSQTFSDPIPLGEAMNRLRSHDFRVVDLAEV